MRNKLAAIILACSTYAFGQSEGLPIGSLRLTLGSDQIAVMSEIKSRYFVVTVSGQPNTFFLSDGKPPNVKVIGGVGFENGKLRWIQRNWGSFAGKGNSLDASKALFSAIESATSISGAAAAITTKVQRVPGGEFKTVYFEFPNRKVTFSTTDGDASIGGQQVSIDESVELPRK